MKVTQFAAFVSLFFDHCIECSLRSERLEQEFLSFWCWSTSGLCNTNMCNVIPGRAGYPVERATLSKIASSYYPT